MNSKTDEKSGRLKIMFKPVMLGGITGFAVILVMLVIMAIILSFGVFSFDLSPLLASISIASGSFIGGLTAAKKSGKKGLITGAASGTVLFFVFTLVSLSAFKTAPNVSTLIRLIIFVLGAAVGGVVGVSFSDKRKIV